MNKVMQAVGRLIRSEKRHRSGPLIDDRYLLNSYRDLFSRSLEGLRRRHLARRCRGLAFFLL
jgi:Rad3-related DNA helicase